MAPRGLEPPTPGLKGQYSNQLSYGADRKFNKKCFLNLFNYTRKVYLKTLSILSIISFFPRAPTVT